MATRKKTDRAAAEAWLSEPVTVRLFRDNGSYKEDKVVTVNGETVRIPRGEDVIIPRRFALVLAQGEAQDARTVVSLIASALDASPDTWPEPDRCGKNEPNVDAELDLMCALVRLRAKQNGVAFPTLASHDDLARVARGYREGVDLLRGWRRALVGEELLELLEGRLALSIDGSELRVEHRS